jgi:septin family protein
MIAVLIMFPGLKSAFSDVVGYFVVANGANNILNVILQNGDLTDKIDKTADEDEKKDLKAAAQAIMKLVGNKGILINQMVPGNFESIWALLTPLMVPDFVAGNMTGDFEITTAKNKLLDLVVLRDNIGESMWYIYTAVLLTSIVSYNLATRGCVKDVQQMQAAHDDYLQQEEEINKQKALNDSVIYKVT